MKYSTFLRTASRLPFVLMIIGTVGLLLFTGVANAAQLKAGVAKVNITSKEGKGLVNDSLFAKALVLDDGTTMAVIVCLDARAIGGKGSISNDFLGIVRSQIQKELNIKPSNVLVTATGVSGERLCSDLDKRTVQAVKKALQNMVAVNICVGKGYEDRIMENRRIELKNGKAWTIRGANPLPPDEEVAGIGPVDPEIGILRLDKKNGETLAVIYNFACHPYQGVPGKGITADFPGFASRVIEDNMSKGCIAIFLQGCLGNITTVLYKDVNNPRDAEPLGNMLGLSTLQALRKIRSSGNAEIKVIDETIELPRRTDIPQRLESLQAEQSQLVQSLRGTSLNIKVFIPLYIKYKLSSEYPSYYSHRYLHDKMIGRNDLEGLDAENRKNIDKYLSNIYAMEKLARIQENLSILKEQLKISDESKGGTIKFEIQCIRIGNFVLVSFPGEPVVQIGLDIKKNSPYEFTFVAAYSNGCIGYSPTADQFKGEDLEDTFCILAPEWQRIYKEKVSEILKKL